MIEQRAVLAESLALPNPIIDWALAATPRADGAVDLAITFIGEASSVTACITVPRPDALDFAQAVRRAAGDGAERTFTPVLEDAR